MINEWEVRDMVDVSLTMPVNVREIEIDAMGFGVRVVAKRHPIARIASGLRKAFRKHGLEGAISTSGSCDAGEWFFVDAIPNTEARTLGQAISIARGLRELGIEAIAVAVRISGGIVTHEIDETEVVM